MYFTVMERDDEFFFFFHMTSFLITAYAERSEPPMTPSASPWVGHNHEYHIQ